MTIAISYGRLSIFNFQSGKHIQREGEREITPTNIIVFLHRKEETIPKSNNIVPLNATNFHEILESQQKTIKV